MFVSMNQNTCLLYNRVNDVYDRLKLFCIEKGFVVKETHEEFYFIRAKKTSFFLWKNMRLEFEILTVEKNKVQVTSRIYKFGFRQPKLEKQYCIAIENLF